MKQENYLKESLKARGVSEPLHGYYTGICNSCQVCYNVRKGITAYEIHT